MISVSLLKTSSGVVYLFNGVEVALHALDSDVFACLDALGFQHLRKSTLTLLTDQTILF
jgi:hypothetical protein